MSENDYREEIARIDTRCVELREQIMQLEFQNKKDIAASQKRFDEWDERITKKISHIAKLAGITYDELDLLDENLNKAGSELTRPREHSIPS